MTDFFLVFGIFSQFGKWQSVLRGALSCSPMEGIYLVGRDPCAGGSWRVDCGGPPSGRGLEEVLVLEHGKAGPPEAHRPADDEPREAGGCRRGPPG